MKRKSFLWEIGCEEIPATWLSDLLCGLSERVKFELGSLGFAVDVGSIDVEVSGTSRRLVVHVTNLPEWKPVVTEKVSGPPLTIAKDEFGNWTKAALGFARNNSVDVSELETISTRKGQYLGFSRKTKEQKTIEELPVLMKKILRGLPFPKFMHWDAKLDDGKAFLFGRPIRWMVALFGTQVVPFEIEVVGAPSVRSGRRSRGHRFLASKDNRAGAPFSVSSYTDLKQKLKQHCVILDPMERRARLRRTLDRLQKKVGAEREQSLDLEIVADLLEWPGAILGNYPDEFLCLPEEIRHTVLVHHQRYFPLLKTSSFIAPTNMKTDPKGNITKGAERVVVARFRDAKFFWDEDLKTPLINLVSELENVVFHAKLGTYGAKKDRVARLSIEIAGGMSMDIATIKRAATLAKCDLVTGMVSEFPELQGIVGGLYAREQGEPEAVWKAIYAHHQPLALEGENTFPLNAEGVVLSLADKLDSLVSMFSVGMVPTGSRDPFALRRTALGIIRLLLESGEKLSFPLNVTLRDLLMRASGTRELSSNLIDFVIERLRFVFMREYRYDEVNAVLCLGALDHSVVELSSRLKAVAAFRGSADFEALAITSKRVRNILSDDEFDKVEKNIFETKAEHDLLNAIEDVEPAVTNFVSNGRYEDALQLLSGLRPHVDRFFDDVLVMTDDEQIRTNRLALLQRLQKLCSEFVDLSEIVYSEAE